MRNNASTLYFFREIVIVVIGVIIAVAIGNYKEQLDNKKYIKKTLLSVEAEIKSGQVDLDTVLNRHIRLYEAFEEGFGESEETLGEYITRLGGFQVASIRNIGVRFFIANKAELLDFELISYLSDIEWTAEILSDKIKRLSDFAYEHVNDQDEVIKTKFGYLLMDVIDSEQRLSELYAGFLENNQAFLGDTKEQGE